MFKVCQIFGTKLIPKIFIKFQDGFDRIMSFDDEMEVGGLSVSLSTNLNRFIRVLSDHNLPVDRCALCGCKVSHFRVACTPHYNYVLEPYGFKKTKEGTFYTPFNKDHIIPISKFKLNAYYNYQFVCACCNNSKASRMYPDEISKVISTAKEVEPECIVRAIRTGSIFKDDVREFYKSIWDRVNSKLWEDSNFVRIVKDIVEKETSIEFDTILEKITKQRLDK